ncbi:hypothetical protein NDU88_006973 [Pleurodeles waltl]|uniref:Uncharacterized protein n=1 Tax=Pleurodeles waltl TaxID=8319 RepID=A0AAV7QJG8_PLEWA|nr:hypothetical protein NDU88_006973 [Pleurodeles waltl]
MSRLVQDRLGLFVKWKRRKVSIEASHNACTYFHFSPRSVLNLPEVAFLKNKRGARPYRLYKDQGSLPRKLTCDVIFVPNVEYSPWVRVLRVPMMPVTYMGWDPTLAHPINPPVPVKHIAVPSNKIETAKGREAMLRLIAPTTQGRHCCPPDAETQLLTVAHWENCM